MKVLNFDADLAKLRSELTKGGFFENCIQKYFLDNPHRVLLTLTPDPEMEKNEIRRVRTELEGIKKELSQSDIDRIKQDAEALERLQETEEDISCLPTLQREDIPPSVPIIKENASEDAVRATLYKTATSGIVYFAAAAGTGLLPPALLPLAPLFCSTLSRMGTTKRDYAEMAQRIDAYTGGIGFSTHARTRFDDIGDCVPFISFNGKCLLRNQEPMFDIIQELLHHSDFSNLTRLKSILLEYRAGLEAMVIHSGHRLAISLAARNLSATRMLSETWSGVHQLQTIKRLTDNITKQDLLALSGDLTAIGKALITQKNFQMALIGEGSALTGARSCAQSLFDGFKPGQDDGFKTPDITLDDGAVREGWSTSSAVSFVALAFETVRMAHEDAPALAVISKILRSMYLHREIREKGGAYGGFALYSLEDGLFSFASYRDPHIVSTLNTFDKAAAWIRSGSFSDEDVKEAILQVCSEIDKPDPPGPAARKAYYRKLISLSDEMRTRFKSRLLSLSRSQVVQAAERYFDENGAQKAVAVISGEDKLISANEKLNDNPLELHRI